MKTRYLAWNEKNKTMHIVTELTMYFEEDLNVMVKTANQKYIMPEDLVLLQFTGHQDDITGKDIYSGHIISFITPLNQIRTGFIEYWIREARFRVVIPSHIAEITDLYIPGNCDGSYYGLHQVRQKEILGNLYETPEVIFDICPVGE